MSIRRRAVILDLDFDATDDRVNGHQEKRFFHGYCKCYCFLSWYVFCGDQLLYAYLRPSNMGGVPIMGQSTDEFSGLDTLEIVVKLISATNTDTGLEVHAWIDAKKYETKRSHRRRTRAN